MSAYVADIKKYVEDVDEVVVDGIVKHCGISLRGKDTSLVSCSQKSELDTIKKSFLKKKLGLTVDDTELDVAIKEVCEKMGSSNPRKHRVTFYYLLTDMFGKQSLFS